MTRRPALWLVPAALLTLGALVFAMRGLPPPTPNSPRSFAFAALGDAPYGPWEEIRYRLVLRDMDAHDLSWSLHVGDIFWRPCTDEHYGQALAWFDGLRRPLIYTPGDNEWADCWEPGSGAYEPLERLRRIREIFFADPARSLGGTAMMLVTQGGREPHGEFPENVRWMHEGVVLATVHLVGSRNGLRPFPGRTADDDDQARRRTEAAAAWTRETFAEAEAAGASAVVLAFHANPSFEEPVSDPVRRAFEPFLTALEEEAERFAKPVLAVHGDNHDYLVDRPLIRRSTGRRLENLTRLQVPGSPEVGWVRVEVRAGPPAAFTFEKRVIPRWKLW